MAHLPYARPPAGSVPGGVCHAGGLGLAQQLQRVCPNRGERRRTPSDSSSDDGPGDVDAPQLLPQAKPWEPDRPAPRPCPRNVRQTDFFHAGRGSDPHFAANPAVLTRICRAGRDSGAFRRVSPESARKSDESDEIRSKCPDLARMLGTLPHFGWEEGEREGKRGSFPSFGSDSVGIGLGGDRSRCAAYGVTGIAVASPILVPPYPPILPRSESEFWSKGVIRCVSPAPLGRLRGGVESQGGRCGPDRPG